jgi:hypothetical protein
MTFNDFLTFWPIEKIKNISLPLSYSWLLYEEKRDTVPLSLSAPLFLTLPHSTLVSLFLSLLQ